MPYPLLAAYPNLASTLPHHPFCDLPTPVTHLADFGTEIDHPSVYIKRDDLSGEIFGGQKVRTLEFLLPSASEAGSNVVVGLPGTSMALATNVYAHKFGIPVETILLDTRPTLEAQTNLRYFQYMNASLHLAADPAEVEALKEQLHQRYDDLTLLSPTSPLGMCGYINAAFELTQQVEQGLLPKPDYIFVSTGLLGTAVGLMLGFKAVGMHTKVIAAHVNAASYQSRLEARQNMVKLFDATVAFLREADDTFPELRLSPYEVMLRSDTSDDPGFSIRRGREWIAHFAELEDVQLDATWTGPAIAMLEREAQTGLLDGKTVLYWHTHNARPYPIAVEKIDPMVLPEAFHHYFDARTLAVVNKPKFLA